MEPNDVQPTTKQLIIFMVILSFIVSIIGSILTIGFLGSPLGASDGASGPFVFNRPAILERITQKETSETVLRQDELVVQVVERASPAVVSVVASKDVPIIEQFFVDPFGGDPFFRQFFGDEFRVPQLRQNGTQRQDVSAGTGFIVSPDGLIVTNKHVVSDAVASYTVLMNDGRKMAAEVLARDPLQDLAILKVTGSNFPFLKVGDSSQVKIGQTAIAIGNALGEFRNTVSVGIVSGLQRSIVATGARGGTEALQELIQSDAAINPGNSGGPLLNLRGEVIGINTAIASGAENISFAIPAGKASRALESVRRSGKIVYPFLGVRYVMITKDLAEAEKLGKDFGALVLGGEGDIAVVPESPAEKAGIKERDIIFEFNGQRVDPGHMLASLIQKQNVGDEVTLKIFREGKDIEVKVKLEELK